MGNNDDPPGGHDDTPLKPTPGTIYTVKITFKSARGLPISDFGKRSTDPYVLAQINSSLPRRHSHDPYLRYRSPTVQRNRDPEWNAEWIVAGLPQSGFRLKVRLYDEDPDDHDDHLGRFYIDTGKLSEKFSLDEECKVHKHGASIRAYTLQRCIQPKSKLHAHAKVAIQVIGRTEKNMGKAYTVNNFYRIHYSPIIGRLTNIKSEDNGVEEFNFQANELQLSGPVPNELYHRYVEFRKFVGGMFEGKGLRGRILHKALHHQHERIYNYNPKTKFGDLEPDQITSKFLEMAQYDEGGRIFTYVITLDGLMRFTETGKEFGIDLLSKHTMHSDVNIYIAWSGEFLIRRLENPNKPADKQRTHPADRIPGGPPDEPPPRDPKDYELIIDNDSGTYRPDEKLLPVLKEYLSRSFKLQVVVKSCTDKDLDKIKEDQREAKKKEGEGRVFGQHSSGSISSSEAEILDERAEHIDEAPKAKVEKVVEALEKPSHLFTTQS